MSRWNDLAEWRGPTANQGPAMTEHRGLVLHIAEGYYDGTISWQRNRGSEVSSHFIVARSGRCAQMVDTATRSWAQKAGNAGWLSVECEGFTTGHRLHRDGWERLTSQQIEVIAGLLVRTHEVYDVPIQVATSPTSRGLGHHSMGRDWGHQDCPGPPIIGQKGVIATRARAIAAPSLPLPGGDDEMKLIIAKEATRPEIYVGNGVTRRWLRTSADLANMQWWLKAKRGYSSEEAAVAPMKDGDLAGVLGVLVGPGPAGVTS